MRKVLRSWKRIKSSWLHWESHLRPPNSESLNCEIWSLMYEAKTEITNLRWKVYFWGRFFHRVKRTSPFWCVVVTSTTSRTSRTRIISEFFFGIIQNSEHFVPDPIKAVNNGLRNCELWVEKHSLQLIEIYNSCSSVLQRWQCQMLLISMRSHNKFSSSCCRLRVALGSVLLQQSCSL